MTPNYGNLETRAERLQDSQMAGSGSLILELEIVIQDGTPERRVEILRRVTNVFIGGASRYKEQHLGIFDAACGDFLLITSDRKAFP